MRTARRNLEIVAWCQITGKPIYSEYLCVRKILAKYLDREYVAVVSKECVVVYGDQVFTRLQPLADEWKRQLETGRNGR